MNKYLLTLSLAIASVMSYGQVIVSGKIVDYDSQSPLYGANIVVKGKVDKGTVADVNGKFSIRMDGKVDAVEVSLEGYEPIRVKLKSVTQNLIIPLPPSIEEAHEVQIIGDQKNIKKSKSDN